MPEALRWVANKYPALRPQARLTRLAATKVLRMARKFMWPEPGRIVLFGVPGLPSQSLGHRGLHARFAGSVAYAHHPRGCGPWKREGGRAGTPLEMGIDASLERKTNCPLHCLEYSYCVDTLMPKSILVVDDDESVADSLRLLLKIDGHEVEVAGDGETALAKYKVGNHDLVIADFFDAGDGWFGVGAID